LSAPAQKSRRELLKRFNKGAYGREEQKEKTRGRALQRKGGRTRKLDMFSGGKVGVKKKDQWIKGTNREGTVTNWGGAWRGGEEKLGRKATLGAFLEMGEKASHGEK